MHVERCGWGLRDPAEARCAKLRLREAREKNATNEESAYLNPTSLLKISATVSNYAGPCSKISIYAFSRGRHNTQRGQRSSPDKNTIHISLDVVSATYYVDHPTT
jgi:hypothetical protein